MRKVLAHRVFSAFDNLFAIATLAGEVSAAFGEAILDALTGRPLPDHEMKALRVAVASPAAKSEALPSLGASGRDKAA
jgi:hypothetical protein